MNATAAPLPLTRPQGAVRKAALGALTPLFKVLGLVAYAVIRLLEPWKRVLVGMVPFERIGHQSTNFESSLRRLAADPERGRILPLFFSGPPANRQLLTMAGRKVTINESRWARQIFLKGLEPLVAGGRFHEAFPDSWGYRSTAWNAAPPQCEFTPEEEERGRALIASMGVPAGAPFVCFIARDTGYLTKFHTHISAQQWAYHDYRNCSAENFLLAGERLGRLGIYTIRLGKGVEKALPPAGPTVIDYASKHWSDFGDIYLTARCKFFLGSEAGFTAVPGCFNKPTGCVSMTPIGYGQPGANDVQIFKTHFDTNKGRALTFREMIAMGADTWVHGDRFREAGIELRENTPEEIAALAEEMNARAEGKWTPPAGDEERQRRYRELYPKGHTFHSSPSRIGAAYLQAHPELLA